MVDYTCNEEVCTLGLHTALSIASGIAGLAYLHSPGRSSYYPVLWYRVEDSGPGDRIPTLLVIIAKGAETAVVICTEEDILTLGLSTIHEERPREYQNGTAFLLLYTGLKLSK